LTKNFTVNVPKLSHYKFDGFDYQDSQTNCKCTK